MIMRLRARVCVCIILYFYNIEGSEVFPDVSAKSVRNDIA